MNPAHLHIILNHIPVIGIPFGIAILSYAFLRKSAEIRTLGLLVFVVIALITIPTYLAGKAAEDIVEDLPGVSEQLIDNHQRAATIALAATSVLGGLSLVRLLTPARCGVIAGPMTILIFVLSLGVAGWLGRTANLGGQIRHSEIRDSAASVGEDDRDEERGRDRDARDREEPRQEEAREDENAREDNRGRGRRGRGRRGRDQ